MIVWVAIAVLALSAQGQSGATGAVEVEAILERDSALIGEPLGLTVSLRPVPSNAEVVFPELPDSGPLIALGPARPLASDGETRSARYQLVGWETGELTVSAGDVRLQIDGTELTISIPDLVLRVVPFLPSDSSVGNIAWKPPADVVGGNWSLAEKIAGASLVLAALIGAVLYVRRRGRGAPVPQPEPIPPRERALTGLDVLARCGLIEAGELKGFYSELSLIMRRFLAETDERWGLDLTTLQLITSVGADGIADPVVHTLEALLSEADLVKFARFRPNANEAAAALKVARTWVDGFVRTEPEPEVPADEDVSGMDVELLEGGAEEVLAELEAVFVAEDGAEEPAGDEEDSGK